MKKKFLVIFSAFFVFALFGAVFALSGTTNAGTEKSATVSCPMQKQNGSVVSADDHKDSCCGMADCCKDGKCSMNGSCCKDKDSCPMKKSQEKESAQTTDMSKVTVVSSGDSCCQLGVDCCKGGACCRKKS